MFATRRARILTLTFLTAFSAALGLLVLEEGLRLILLHRLSFAPMTPYGSIMEPHPTRGWTPRPNASLYVQTLDYAVTSQTNSKGLYDVEHTYEKPEGVFRIVVLGDSYMTTDYAALDDILPHLLEERLQPEVEVINLGVTGYGTTQEYLYLAEEGVKYHPDLVLLAFYAMNDIRNNFRPLESRIWGENDQSAWGRPYAATAGDELTFTYPDLERLKESMSTRREAQRRKLAATPWYERTMTWTMTTHVLARFQNRYRNDVFDPNIFLGAYLKSYPEADTGEFDYAQTWESAWEITVRLVRATSDVASRAGAQFAIFTVPSRLQVDDHYQQFLEDRNPGRNFDFHKFETRLEEVGKAHEIPVFDLYPAFAEGQSSRPLFFQIEDQHWNAAGHQVATEALIAWLRKEELIPQD